MDPSFVGPAFGVVVGLIIGLIGALIRHTETDAKARQELADLKARVTKLDGINGH